MFTDHKTCIFEPEVNVFIFSSLLCLSLWNLLNSNLIANTIQFFLLIISGITLIIVITKANDFLQAYKEKQVNAVFGYYFNLIIYIERLESIIFDGESVNNVVFYLSPTQKLQEKANGNDEIAKKLKMTASELIHYLSTESNQVPPYDSNEEFGNWKNEMISLMKYLTVFSLIGDGIHIPEMVNENSAEQYMKTFSDLINKIKRDIDTATNTFYKSK